MASIWDQWAAMPGFSQVANDPRYLLAAPAYRQKIHDILFNYGLQPTVDQNAADGGMTIENNPYSVLALLRNSQQTANHGTINNAYANGVGESGAALAGLNANTENYKQGVSDATAKATGELGQATTDFTGLVGGIFGDAENNPIIPPAVPGPGNVGPAPGAPTGTGTAFPTPQQPYNRTGPETPLSVSSKVKKIKPLPSQAARAL